MRRIASLLAVPVLAAGASLVSGGPAAALGGESLDCTIAPSHQLTPSGMCVTNLVSQSYGIAFFVQNLSGSYSFSWTPPQSTKVTSGCNSGSSFCDINVPATAGDRDLVATVVLTQGGAQETLTATAFIPAVCGDELC